MATAQSIFPSVTVTQIRPLQANNKPLPKMSVGLIGPRFKRLTEVKTNGYFINPDDAPSVSVALTGPSDGEYIDFDSVKVSLQLASTGELLDLNSSDEEVVPIKTLVQSGLDQSGIGTYEVIDATDWVFMTTKLATQTYGAVIGDYLMGPTSSNIFTKINQVVPVKFSDNNFVMVSGLIDPGVTTTFTITGYVGADDDYNKKWLVAIDKNDSTKIYQFKITDSDLSDSSLTIAVADYDKPNDPENDLSVTATAVNTSLYNWYVYDIPLGSLKTYDPGVVTAEGLFSIYNYNLRISPTSGQGTYGKMALTTRYPKYFFVPDSKALSSYYGVNAGDVLKATLRSNTAVEYDFRIATVGVTRVYQMSTVPTDYTNLVYTFGTSEDIKSQFTAGQYLVAIKKSDPYISKSFCITSVGTSPNFHKVTIDLTGEWDDTAITTGNCADYDWYLYSAPIGSLELEGGTDFTTVSGAPQNYDFSIVNVADYYISGKQEVTILNYLSDAEGLPVGLADVLLDYKVLVTADTNQLWDITDSTLQEAKCGTTATDSINPLGLASLLVESNTIFAYKVIPTDIALTERDPDAPKSYSGKYTSTNTTYHNVNNLDWTSAKEVLEAVKDTQIPYYIIPLSADASVCGMFGNTVVTLSEPNKMKEMLTFISTSLPDRETVLANINNSSGDFSVNNDRLRYHPSTKYVSSEDPLHVIDFLTIGAKKGDYIVYEDVDEIEYTVKIVNIYPTYFDLGVVDNFTGDVSGKLNIVKIYLNKDEIAEALSKKGELYNSYRIKVLWGDYVDITLGTDTYTSVPMYYGAAAYAAMANNIGTVLPKTNRIITGISRVYNVNPFFSIDQLETIGSGLIDILTQDYDGGPVYSKRQFMTDGSELSGVEPVDKLAKHIRTIFRPYLGKNNITGSLFDVLGLVLAGVIDVFVPSEFTDLVITSPLTVSGLRKDRLTLKLRPTTYKPFNGLDVTVEVE
jgi:hypothetical protein